MKQFLQIIELTGHESTMTAGCQHFLRQSVQLKGRFVWKGNFISGE
ncbi:hypothetical protein [Brevibacillus laterosporus]